MGNYDIALYGLGVMGSSLAKNMIGKGFKTALYGKSEAERNNFSCEQGEFQVFSTVEQLVSSLNRPKIIFMMVTAGKVVDLVIEELLPLLQPGDVLIDGGNSYFKDTARRCAYLKEKGIEFLGLGVSGGEKGALTGPSMMAGGSKRAWEVSKTILQSMAAKAEGESCCDYVGAEGAGHYVKMVHNGIEYAVIQLIADAYFIMKNGLYLPHEAIRELFAKWKEGSLSSYLIDITVDVLSASDEDGALLIDKILDVAKQKGTGSWTLEEAVSQGVYVPAICESVFMRYFSANKELREEGAKKLKVSVMPMELESIEQELEDALLASIICSYAQGIELIQKASEEYGWNIDLQAAVKLWREGCIIRSRLLSDIVEALEEKKQNILLTEKFGFLGELERNWRKVILGAIGAGIAVPTLASSIQYYDCCRTKRMSVNMVQALRDCFGAHTYERIDKKGAFHTNWN